MHPPRFREQDRLSDWPECTIQPVCQPCATANTSYPVKWLINRYGDITFEQVLRRLVCKTCRKPPAPVYLVAGHHRTFCYAGTPDWTLEVVRPPERQKPPPR